MKAVIIEDEKAAVRNLTTLLFEVAPHLTIEATMDSIAGALEWFAVHPTPDVVFMDIHLADGSAFEIFEHTTLLCPIIFTTAYDEFALRAFKVNSVDYLLKPIAKEEVERALAKLHRLTQGEAEPSSASPFNPDDLLAIMRTLKAQEGYKSHFLLPIKGDKLLPVSVDRIGYFYIHEGQVRVVLTDGNEYPFTQTLEELAECLNPSLFFRANRQYFIARTAVKDIDLWFNSRLAINLHHAEGHEKIIISKARVGEFKEWFESRR